MRFIFLLSISCFLATGCLDDDNQGGFNTSISRLAIYDFDVNIDIVPGEDTFTEFSPSDSTMILQISRTVDPDITVGGDDTSETIYIVLPNDLDEFEIDDNDWADTKTYAFTSGRTVNLPVGRVTGGLLEGRRDPLDNSWTLVGQLELSETFETTFPFDLTGRYQAL